MQGKKEDLINKKFNKLTAIEEIKDFHRGVSRIRYLCLCDCGNTKIVLAYNLKHNQAKACDSCKFSQKGLTKVYMPFYRKWQNMMRRCYIKKNYGYKDYGERGIKVCDRWHSFKNFYEDMYPTYKTGLTIDRIDNNADYCKENCRWATRQEQARNQRSNITVNFKGQKMILADVADILGIKRPTIYSRYSRGFRGESLFKK